MENNIQPLKKKNGCLFKIIIAVFAVYYFLNYNNPVSHYRSYKTVNGLIEEKYPGYEITELKMHLLSRSDTMYATLQIPGSPDSEFAIHTDLQGNCLLDTYQRDVRDKANVDMRISNEYIETVRDFLEEELRTYGRVQINGGLSKVPKEKLVLDKQYTAEEIKDLSADYGIVSIYFLYGLEDATPYEVARRTKEVFVENDLCFYTIRINNDYDTQWYLIK